MHNEVENKGPATQNESFSELLGQLFKSSAAMVRDEIELVIQGIREKGREVLCGVLTIATGVFIGFAAFMSLCAAVIIGLSCYMAPVMAAIVTGAALALVGVVIAFIGWMKLKKSMCQKTETSANSERNARNG